MKHSIVALLLAAAFCLWTAVPSEADETTPAGAAVFQDEASFLAQADGSWQEIADGVWEKRKPDGGFVRLGFGPSSFEFALAEARRERERLAAAGESALPAQAARRLADIDGLIQHLEAGLDAAPTWQTRGASDSDYVCGGGYQLNASVSFGIADGSAHADGSWSEFGPFAPYQHRLYAYARAEWPGYADTDSDSTTFSGQCCASVDADA